jgi:iron complex outermembrane receptor protein
MRSISSTAAGSMRLATALCAVAGLATAAPIQAQPTTLSLDSLLSVRISAASRYEQTVAEAPASVTVVTSEDIERFGYRTVDEVLEGVRGFQISSDRNYSYIGVRGLARPTDYNNRLLVLLNGHALNETFYNSIYGGPDLGVPLHAIDRIEIVRGPASALYGTSAMLAVVNIVTKAGETLQGAGVSASGGSFAQRDVSAVWGGLVSGVDVLVAAGAGRTDGPDLYFSEYDDPTTNNGMAEDVDWERFESLLATARAGNLSLQVRTSSRRKGIPTGAWGSNFNDGRARTRDEWTSAGLQYTRRAGASVEWSVGLSASRYAYRGWYPSDVLYLDENIGHWGGVDGHLVWDPSPGHRIIAGFDVVRTSRAQYDSWAEGYQGFAGDFPFTTWSMSVADELALTHALSVIAGLRWDQHSEGPNALSPRAGVLYHPVRSTTLKLLWGNAFRAPSVYEREYYSSQFARAQDLVPERARTSELVWEQRVGHELRITTSAYYTHVENLIDTFSDAASGMEYFANLGHTDVHGVETELTLRRSDGITGYMVYGYQKAVDGRTGDRLTNAPRHTVKAGLSASTLLGTISTEARHEGARSTVQGTTTGEAIVVNGSFRSRTLFGGMSVTARVRDLFDSGFRVPGGVEHVQASIPQGPRTLSVGFTYEWN